MRGDALRILKEAIDGSVFNCAALGFVKDGEIVEPVTVGIAGKGTLDEFEINADSIFDVASVTKSVPVSTLALIALDRQQVSLSTPVTELLSEYHSPDKHTVNFSNLLNQDLDFGFALSEMKQKDAAEIYRAIMTAPLVRSAGSSSYYCNATSVILARTIEQIYQKPLDLIADGEIFVPLGMRDSFFRPSQDLRSRIVPSEIDQWRGRVIKGEIHDESSWKLNEIIIPGAAGLFSTVSDLQKYLKEILVEEKRLFSKGFLDSRLSLAFETDQDYMGEFRGEGCFGKSGFTGSVIVGDKRKKSGFVLLTDYTYPVRKTNRDAINNVRANIADLLWQILF